MSQQPEDLTPREAWQRYIDRRRPESTDHSMKTYYYRLKQFVEWCERQQIERVSELDGWTFENYETHRAGEGLAPVTLNGEMKDLRLFVEYLERIEAVEDGLSDRIHIPKVSDNEASSDKKLATEDAKPLLEYYRRYDKGSRSHALLEVFWNTGARLGALRALDVRDYHSDEQYLEFVHRPESDTPLKKKVNGERPVALSDAAADALDAYLVSDDRWDKHDDHGREPLFTSRLGRPGQNTVRCWSYLATLPCLHSECPHGRKRETCEFTERNKASQCPSSRSPHQIRTGSITYQLDSGLPPEVVATRVNASVETIKKHYDKATPRQRMQRRRRRYVDRLEFDS
ncbi:tyrosine-type recombinase/integrase [Halobacterium noricense]|uniref:tyrosine-type recombinase/integrase n=1 Tax=Halobacterium noricense TaxID=223182 RepID=UPI001E5E2002|nr:tyrosine-type recombinase/integrase [Halobacterium noricense]UHH26479.1 tyrosine-type recombinase/integrase [Halobacterium noricense]